MLKDGNVFNIDLIKIIAAFTPLFWLFISLWKLKMPVHKAGLTALFLTAGLVFLLFGANVQQMGQAALEGIMLSIFPIAIPLPMYCLETFRNRLQHSLA